MKVCLKHYAGTSLISRAIGAHTRHPYSHVAIEFPPLKCYGKDFAALEVNRLWEIGNEEKANAIADLIHTGRAEWSFDVPTIYEATWPRVLKRNSDSREIAKTCDDFILDFDEANLAAGLLFLELQVGKRYDWNSVMRFVTRSQAIRETDGVWFCSELAFVFSQKVGKPLLKNCQPWEVSPRDTSFSPVFSHVFLRAPRVPEWKEPLRPQPLPRHQ